MSTHSDFFWMVEPELERTCLYIARALAKRRRAGPAIVGIQLPEGLRSHFRELAKYVSERTGAATAMLVEMCCGACMAEVHPAIDAVLHFAHDSFSDRRRKGLKVYHVSYTPKLDVAKCVREAVPSLKGPVGVLTTSTHASFLPDILKELKSAGLKPLLGKSRRTGNSAIVLGCDLAAARSIAKRANSFLFVGSGSFHPIGVELATGRVVVGADPYSGEVRTFGDVKDRILRQRFAAIAKARDARTFGVLLGLYPGQQRRKEALSLLRLLEKNGRDAYLLAARQFSPDNVDYLGIDALVSTACPRIAIDDGARYRIPVLTPQELDIALGKLKWDDYRMDEFE
jgi:2-(3-amino-3-carboxypropyl)histidine synthase